MTTFILTLIGISVTCLSLTLAGVVGFLSLADWVISVGEMLSLSRSMSPSRPEPSRTILVGKATAAMSNKPLPMRTCVSAKA